MLTEVVGGLPHRPRRAGVKPHMRSALTALSFTESLHFLVPAILYGASNTLAFINPAVPLHPHYRGGHPVSPNERCNIQWHCCMCNYGYTRN